MNILYISSKKRWGGVASWMVKTALALLERGHNIWILSHPNSKISEEIPSKINHIKYKLGFEYNPLSILYITKLIKKLNINLLVTNLEKEVAIGGIAARIAKIPNIRRVGREDDFNSGLKSKWNQNNLVFSSIVPCNAIKNGAQKRASWLNNKNFKTIYNGRNPVNFSIDQINQQRKNWRIKNDEFVIGITVQLLRVKQVDKLIEAFKLLRDKFDKIKLVICGVGKEANNLQKLTNFFGINKDVIFAGFTEKPLLAAAAYDIAVLCSRLEGFPNTIVEYFSVGKPVVSTNVGGVSEIIKDGYNGFLVEIDDIKGIAEKIEILLLNNVLRKQFSHNALKTLNEKFTEKKMIDDLESYYLGQIKKYARVS